MTRKLPPLNAIRAFEAAARHVSFTRSAEELNVTHGAVSRQVAQLEEWLGTPLFKRAASQLTLTEAGRLYAREATAALDRLAVASTQLIQQAEPTILNVNAPPTFTMRWLIPRMSGFQRIRPDVEIRLTTSVEAVNFQEHAYDIAIRGLQAPLEACASSPFMTEIITPVCHADLCQNNRMRQPEDLQKETLLGYATEPYSWPDWLAAAGSRTLVPANTLRFEQMYFALQAAAEGLGIVLVPLFLVVDEIIAGRLCAPFGVLAAKQRTYYANSAMSAARKRPVIDEFYAWLIREGRNTEESIASWAATLGWELPPTSMRN